MNCNKIRKHLGCYLDHELAPDVRAKVSDHLQRCAACSQELERLEQLASGLCDASAVTVPPALWDSIAQQLDSESGQIARPHHGRRWNLRRKSWALAASIILAVGLGTLGLNVVGNSAKAAPINFAALLDALPLDAPEAFQRFIALYDGHESSPADAERHAPSLNFATPSTLPGGFRLNSVYVLKFGDHPGVAAWYERDGEFLATIFHPPVTQENFGTHRDYPCAIGKHRGHKVQVGPWKMVHLTDPTTCHCVLSRLDEKTELPAVMSAVAPNAPITATPNHDH